MASAAETSVSHHHKYVLISNAESYVGHALAHHLVEELARRRGQLKKHWRVRVLCRSREHMGDLERIGADVQQVNYESLVMLKQMMANVKCVILVPDMSDHLARNGKNIIDAASECGVKRMQMASSVACEFVQEHQGVVGQILCLERHLREEYSYGRWCVFRMSFLHQFFYLWNRMIEHRGCIGMPIPENAKLTCMSIHDMCDAMATLLLSPKKQEADEDDDDQGEFDIPEQAVKRIYQLTGRCPYTGEDIANRLNEAVGAARGEITFSEISAREMREYLETTAGIRAPSATSWLASIVRNLTGHDREHDRPGFVPDPRRHLNPVAIDMFMQCFEMVKEHRMAKITMDLRDLIGKEPMDLKDFFYENRHEFRRPSHRDSPK